MSASASARRVAFVSTMAGNPWGGSEVLWTLTAMRALRRGDAVWISTHDTGREAAAIRECEGLGAAVVARPARPGRWTGVVVTPSWLRDLSAFEPDVVCVSLGAPDDAATQRSTRGLIPLLMRMPCRVVTVVQFAHEQRQWSAGASRRTRELFDRAEVNAFVAAGNIGAVSRQLGDWPIPRATVVRNPVNLADTSEMGWPDERVIEGGARFACVARLQSKTKGQRTLIEAFASPAWAGRAWSLSFAGTGPDQLELERLVGATSLAGRVHVLGQVADVRELWTRHHALVLASRAEGTPLAMVEAMLLGRVCITTRVGGCGEWIEDGVTGFLAADPTARGMAEVLERAWSVRAKWPEIGRAAAARARERVDPDPAGTLLGLIDTAAASRR